MSTRRKGGSAAVVMGTGVVMAGSSCLCAKTRQPARQSGMLPCFLGGLTSRLSASISSAAIRRGRVSDGRMTCVDVPARRRGVGIRELRLVLPHQPRRSAAGSLRACDAVAEDDVDRPLDAHDRDLGGGPREVHVAPDVLAAHDVIGAAIGLARDDRQLGHRRLAVRIEQLRAMADDSAVLLGDAGQESRERRRRSRAAH